MIPFIDLHSQYKAYKDEIKKELNEVLDSSGFIFGPKVELLEEKLASYVGTSFAITCSSGTDALVIALMALNVGIGDEIIVPAFSFFATAEAVSLLGAVPVFADVLPDSFCLDPQRIEELISDKTRAIIPVSLFGQIGPMEEYEALAVKHGIFLIEDGAQSFGAEQKGQKSLSFGDLGTVSFFPAKPLGAYGEGGAVFTNDESLQSKIVALRNHGQSERYFHNLIGINGRMDAMQAAILLVKLKHFDEERETRQLKADRYKRGLAGLEGLEIPVVKKDNLSSYAQFTLLVKQRDELVEFLNGKGVPTAIHYPLPLPRQPVYSVSGYDSNLYPVSENLSRDVISLPFSAFLSDEDQDGIIDNIREWARNR